MPARQVLGQHEPERVIAGEFDAWIFDSEFTGRDVTIAPVEDRIAHKYDRLQYAVLRDIGFQVGKSGIVHPRE